MADKDRIPYGNLGKKVAEALTQLTDATNAPQRYGQTATMHNSSAMNSMPQSDGNVKGYNAVMPRGDEDINTEANQRSEQSEFDRIRLRTYEELSERNRAEENAMERERARKAEQERRSAEWDELIGGSAEWNAAERGDIERSAEQKRTAEIERAQREVDRTAQEWERAGWNDAERAAMDDSTERAEREALKAQSEANRQAQRMTDTDYAQQRRDLDEYWEMVGKQATMTREAPEKADTAGLVTAEVSEKKETFKESVKDLCQRAAVRK